MADKHSSRVSIQKKVDRFVSGARNPRDLDAIFLWIRSKSFGLKTIKDIGDFVAHADEKNTGVVWDKASRLSSMFNFLAASINGDLEPTIENLQAFKTSRIAVFELDDPASVKRATKVGQKAAKRLLESALGKIVVVDGKYETPGITTKESEILHRYSTLMIIAPAYDDAKLVAEFIECLTKNALLNPDDAPKIQAAGQFLAVYAIEKMHFCKLVLDNGNICRLVAGVSKEENKQHLTVTCEMPVTSEIYSGNFLTDIFSTTCGASEWVDESLWEHGKRGYWTVPIELTSDGKLTETI